MSAIWFSSDTHFLHRMVAELRGFASSEEHDEVVIAAWNNLVRPADLVWHLGDVGLGNETRVLEQAARLNGRKQLIAGNHDPCWPGHRDSRKHQRRWLDVFESVQAFARIRLGGRAVLLSHMPYEGDHTETERHTQFRLRDEGAWLLHGHTHQPNRLGPNPHYLTMMDPVNSGGITTPRGREVHVGLDAWDLVPVSEARVLGVIGEYEQAMDLLAANGPAPHLPLAALLLRLLHVQRLTPVIDREPCIAQRPCERLQQGPAIPVAGIPPRDLNLNPRARDQGERPPAPTCWQGVLVGCEPGAEEGRLDTLTQGGVSRHLSLLRTGWRARRRHVRRARPGEDRRGALSAGLRARRDPGPCGGRVSRRASR